MRNVLIMVGTAVALFAATVIGMLGLLGRLNHEGTAGIPLISALFPPEEIGEPPQTSPPAADPQASPPVEDPADDAHREEHTPVTPSTIPANALLERGSYRPGALFAFPALDSGLTADEVNSYLGKAKEMLADAERKLTALDEREAELTARQRDIEDRENAISEKMIQVNLVREALDKRILEFEKDVTLVRQSDTKGIKDYARTLASFSPNKASAYVLEEWKTEAGRRRIIRVMALMQADAADAIIAEMDNARIKEVLVERLKVIVEPDETKRRK